MPKKLRLLVTAIAIFTAPATAWAARGYTTDDVRMRAGPSTEYPVVATISDGARVIIYGCLNDYGWCDVGWRGDRGWVNAYYLKYYYRDRYVYLPDYVDVIDIPIVTFALGTYWAHHYSSRPWYHRRAYWEHYRHSHRHSSNQRHEERRQIIHERSRLHSNSAPHRSHSISESHRSRSELRTRRHNQLRPHVSRPNRGDNRRHTGSNRRTFGGRAHIGGRQATHSQHTGGGHHLDRGRSARGQVGRSHHHSMNGHRGTRHN